MFGENAHNLSSEQQEESEIVQAEIEISGIIQFVYGMGANDHEIPNLMEIRRQVGAREISPEDGIKQAREIEKRKQDYH